MTNPAEPTPGEHNRLMMERVRAGDPAPYQEGQYVLRVMTVPGRKSGEPRSLPIAIPTVAGEHYLCGPNRRRDWVRNLLAAGECEIERDPLPRHRAVLIENDTAASAVHTYLAALGRPSTEWPFPSDAPVSEIATHVGEIAVFRLEPVQL